MVEQFKNPLLRRLFFLRYLPLALFAGVKLSLLAHNKCEVSIPYKWITKNPFKSMYFAAQSMAAEFSTAVLLVSHIEKSKANLALIIVSMKANFLERAQERITFTCKVDEDFEKSISNAIETAEAEEIELITIGTDLSGNKVSEFSFTWSIKLRSK